MEDLYSDYRRTIAEVLARTTPSLLRSSTVRDDRTTASVKKKTVRNQEKRVRATLATIGTR